MLSTVEAWRAGLCARPFDGAQGDNPTVFLVPSPREGCGGIVLWQGGVICVMQVYMVMKPLPPLPEGRNRTEPWLLIGCYAERLQRIKTKKRRM
ncbi:hypothetical protein SAMN05428975_2700 [Mucilaginibacter sp. OK268]|jgi:hypothetical protein|nr:hypothetical protein SAMN05428975_2700 [Mucilaginibacter sp. OK268]